MFGFGSPFTSSPTRFYGAPRYGGVYGQPSCRCPDCCYGSEAPFYSPARSTRRSRPPAEFGWPFSTPYTSAYGPTEGRTASRRPVRRPAWNGSGAPARKESSAAPARGDESEGEFAHGDMTQNDAIRSPRRERSVESKEEPQKGDIAQKPSLNANEKEQHIECTSPAEELERASNSSSDSNESTHDNPAMDDIIPAKDSPSPVSSQPEDGSLKLSTLAQIAQLSEQAKELQNPAMSFAGVSGSKEYLFLSESLMDILLKLDLIESNGVKEVRDARRSAVVMIQEVLGLLESRAMKNQTEVVLTSAEGDDSEEDSDGAEREGSREEALKEDIADRGEGDVEAMSDDDQEQDSSKEEVLRDDIVEHGEGEEETMSDDMTEEGGSQEDSNRTD